MPDGRLSLLAALAVVALTVAACSKNNAPSSSKVSSGADSASNTVAPNQQGHHQQYRNYDQDHCAPAILAEQSRHVRCRIDKPDAREGFGDAPNFIEPRDAIEKNEIRSATRVGFNDQIAQKRERRAFTYRIGDQKSYGVVASLRDAGNSKALVVG